MKKLGKRILPVVLCGICLLAMLSGYVFAAEAIDTGADAMLTIEYRQDGKPVEGIPFDLYYVATVNEAAELSLTGDFASYAVDLDKRDADSWRALASTLAAYASRDGLTPLDSGKTSASGLLVFPAQQERLACGLYLAVGRALTRDGVSYLTEPLLVMLPYAQEGAEKWSYAVVAEPKHTAEPVTPEEETTSRSVLKLWENDIKAIRPTQIQVQLLKDGALYEQVTLNAENNWRYTWDELPRYRDDGTEISWQLTEQTPADYTVLVSREGTAFVVTNTYHPQKTDYTVQKVWEDTGYEGRRPKTVTVTLLRNGSEYDTCTLSAENSWQHTWTNLPKLDETDGQENRWSIRETPVKDYTAKVTQNGTTFVLTNRYKAPELPRTGQLWWPVPVLAAAGLLALLASLLTRKKKA